MLVFLNSCDIGDGLKPILSIFLLHACEFEFHYMYFYKRLYECSCFLPINLMLFFYTYKLIYCLFLRSRVLFHINEIEIYSKFFHVVIMMWKFTMICLRLKVRHQLINLAQRTIKCSFKLITTSYRLVFVRSAACWREGVILNFIYMYNLKIIYKYK